MSMMEGGGGGGGSAAHVLQSVLRAHHPNLIDYSEEFIPGILADFLLDPKSTTASEEAVLTPPSPQKGSGGGYTFVLHRVEADAVGRIVGAKGRRIAELRSQSGAEICTVSGSAVADVQHFKICGSPASVELAKRLIDEIAAQDVATVAVPEEAVGRIIGQRGRTVARLETEHAVRIRVKRVVQCTISGARSNVRSAARAVQDIIGRSQAERGRGERLAASSTATSSEREEYTPLEARPRSSGGGRKWPSVMRDRDREAVGSSSTPEDVSVWEPKRLKK
jgi:predicted RNA-binding protein YlqC (UPF0109 family)